MRVDIFCLLLKNAVIFLRDGNGGMRVAWAWRLHGNFWDFLGIFGRVIGAPCDTPWVCCAAVWYGSGENVPLRYAVITVARHKEPVAVPTGKSVRDF